MDKTLLDQAELGRRDFFRTSAALSAGLLTIGGSTAASEAPAAAAPLKPLSGKMTVEQVLDRAREMMSPKCVVCAECDGEACAGQVPGLGGVGTGKSFQNNYRALDRIELNQRVVHSVKRPDTSFDFFGTRLSMPALAAPTAGTTYNMGGKLSEEEFVAAICGGCSKAGTLGAVADGIGDPIEVFEQRLQTLKGLGFKATAGLKPRTQEEIIQRMKMAAAAGVVAITIDLDSAGRAARATPGQTVEPKTPAQLKELVKACPVPLIFKGIMTVDEARVCMNSGAAGIVVSNHGGRVLAATPGTADVLPKIADSLRGKLMILVDGTVKRGTDVQKYLALGADGVLVGRHFIRAAHGGGADGVALFANRMRDELVVSMTLTGAAKLKAIKRNMIA